MVTKNIIIERDIDQDRFLNYDQFKDFVYSFPALGKWQIYYMLSGVCGWRPCEMVSANLSDIDFEQKKIKRRIRKPRQKKEFQSCDVCEKSGKIPKITKNKRRLIKCPECEGDGYIKYNFKYVKIKWSHLPDWAFNMLTEYIKREFPTMKSGYLFPSKDSPTGHIHPNTPRTLLGRVREDLFEKDPEKWYWVKRKFQTVRYSSGKTQNYYNLSLYSFRKMHVSYYAQMLLDKGFTDVIFHTMRHIGHSQPATTVKYLQNLLDDKPLTQQAFQPIGNVPFLNSLPKVSRDQKKLSDYGSG